MNNNWYNVQNHLQMLKMMKEMEELLMWGKIEPVDNRPPMKKIKDFLKSI